MAVDFDSLFQRVDENDAIMDDLLDFVSIEWIMDTVPDPHLTCRYDFVDDDGEVIFSKTLDIDPRDVELTIDGSRFYVLNSDDGSLWSADSIDVPESVDSGFRVKVSPFDFAAESDILGKRGVELFHLETGDPYVLPVFKSIVPYKVTRESVGTFMAGMRIDDIDYDTMTIHATHWYDLFTNEEYEFLLDYIDYD